MFNPIDKKRLNEKFKRVVKYWRVRYQQSNDRERLHLYLSAFVVVTYMWWLLIAL